MVRRHERAAFMGGAYVFPGGAVDAADRDAADARWCDGIDHAAAQIPGAEPTEALALHVAAGLVGDFRDGVWLVELAMVQAAHLVPYAVAAVLGRHERAGEALTDAIVAYLEGRELLLVLDNCEHLIDACADLAGRLVSDCPRVRLLATSRERLRIGAETTWRVPSLASPDPHGTLARRPTIRIPAPALVSARRQSSQTCSGTEQCASVAASARRGTTARTGTGCRPRRSAFSGANPRAARPELPTVSGR